MYNQDVFVPGDVTDMDQRKKGDSIRIVVQGKGNKITSVSAMYLGRSDWTDSFQAQAGRNVIIYSVTMAHQGYDPARGVILDNVGLIKKVVTPEDEGYTQRVEELKLRRLWRQS